MVSFIHPEAKRCTTGGEGDPSGAGGKSDGTNNWTNTDELLPIIGISWNMSLAKPDIELDDPLGVQSRSS